MSGDDQREEKRRAALRAAGQRDGYAVGRSGIDPDGNPAAYDEASFPSSEYRQGLREGRTQRIDDYTAARGGHDDGLG